MVDEKAAPKSLSHKGNIRVPSDVEVV